MGVATTLDDLAEKKAAVVYLTHSIPLPFFQMMLDMFEFANALEQFDALQATDAALDRLQQQGGHPTLQEPGVYGSIRWRERA